MSLTSPDAWFAYFIGMKDSKFIAGFSALEVDAAITRGELDGRANNAASVLRRNPEWFDKGLMNFHAIMEVPKESSNQTLGHLPEIESFAKTERDKKVAGDVARLSPSRLTLHAAAGHAERTGRYLARSSMRKALRDPEFHREFLKLVGDEAEPLMPEELAQTVSDTPRDVEITELLKTFSGSGPLPSR